MPGLADFSQVSGALEQLYRRVIVGQQNRSDVTLSLLRKQAGAGKNSAVDVSVGTDTGQVFDDGQVVTTFNNDLEIPAIQQWSEVGDAFKITGKAEDAAASSNTELGNLFLTKMMGASRRAAEKANAEVLLGDGSAGPQRLAGLMSAAGPLDSTGTYSGIARSTHAQWASNKLANAGIPRAVSVTLLEQMLDAIWAASGTAPTFGVTTPLLWSAIAALGSASIRRNQEVYVRGEKLHVSMGYQSVEINGIPIFRDKDFPAGKLAFINGEHTYLEYLPVASMRMQRGSKFLGTYPISGTPQEMALSDYGNVPNAGAPLMAALIELPFVGDATQYMFKSTVALRCDKPNACGQLLDLTA